MNRLTILKALALIILLSLPTAAGPFTDVPLGHWAEEALERIAGTNIIIGYPDLSFRGMDLLNRYEMSVILSRLLDWIIDIGGEDFDPQLVIAALETEGLTSQQAEEVLLILYALGAEYFQDIVSLQSKAEEMDQLLLEFDLQNYQALTEQQEFNRRIKELFANLAKDYDTFTEGVHLMDQRLFALQQTGLSFALAPQINYRVTTVDGAVGYYNPFDAATIISEGSFHSYRLPLSIFGRNDFLEVDLTLDIEKPDFNTFAEPISIEGLIKTPDFSVSLLDAHSTVYRPYLFGLDDQGQPLFGPAYINAPGVKTYFEHGEIGLYSLGGSDVYSFGLEFELGSVYNQFMLGSSSFMDPYAAGLYSKFSLFNIDFDIDLATSDPEELEIFFGLGAKTQLFDLITFNATLDYIDGYEPFYGVVPAVGSATEGIENLGFMAGFDIPLGLFSVGADYTNRGAAQNIVAYLKMNEALRLGLLALISETSYTFNFDNPDTIGLAAGFTYGVDNLLAMALEYRLFLDDFFIDSHGLEGELIFTPLDILQAGAKANFDFITTNLGPQSNIWAHLAPGPYALMDFDILPSADLAYYFMGSANAQLNYATQLALSRELNDHLSWATRGLFAYQEVSDNAAVNYGNWLKLSTGLDYATIFNFDLEVGRYIDELDPNLDYIYREIKGGISLSF